MRANQERGGRITRSKTREGNYNYVEKSKTFSHSSDVNAIGDKRKKAKKLKKRSKPKSQVTYNYVEFSDSDDEETIEWYPTPDWTRPDKADPGE